MNYLSNVVVRAAEVLVSTVCDALAHPGRDEAAAPRDAADSGWEMPWIDLGGEG